MHTYIYDRYGYLVEDEFAKDFTYQNWFFRLEVNNKSEQELYELNNFIINVDNLLFKRGVRIIENKNNLLSSNSEFGQLSLVGVNIFNVSLVDIMLMHNAYLLRGKNEFNLNISSIKELWIKKTDNVENKILPSLKIDNYLYEIAYSMIQYHLALAESAISYLQDLIIDYGDIINEVTLTHKRIKELNSYELLNPFNLVIDSPMRDLADLYLLDVINENNIETVLNKYQMNQQKASLLLSRILFPSSFFDLLEENFILKKEIKKEIKIYYDNLDTKIKKIKYIHNYLVSNYGIREINWLSLK